ncbi:MAG: hypothetical protein A7315_06795 [Candidatus Altiarchaeales archaeon WOR_SM1_79]|nr:MAG: hypothetical protein A7315_06795 [Candidatus Altiarchaeales archaeon WOR_SM1_79]
MKNVKTLSKLLEDMGEEGEKMATQINRLLVDDRLLHLLKIQLEDLEQEIATLSLRQDITLKRRERIVREFILDQKRPLTAEEIANSLGKEHKSLGYGTHISAVLNSLMDKGIVGKVKIGRKHYFTNPKEAVMGALKQMGMMPKEEYTSDEIRALSDATGMPISSVLLTLDELI